MGLYNIVNASSMVAGQPEDISQVLANFQAIQTILNGGLDNSNITAAAAIVASKLAGYPADGTKVLKGDGSWSTVGTTALTGYPADATKFLRGDGTWSVAIRNATLTVILTGTVSYTTPTGTSEILVEAIAAGGGGGGCATVTSAVGSGASAGGGAYAGSFVQSPVASYTVAVGAGGPGGAAGANNGTVGGDTSFNTTTVVAKGGQPGQGSTANATVPRSGGNCPLGGLASACTGQFAVDGGVPPPTVAANVSLSTNGSGGQGAGPYGGKGAIWTSTAGTGATGGQYGGGGAGGLVLNGSASAAGGPGGAGVLVVTNFS